MTTKTVPPEPEEPNWSTAELRERLTGRNAANEVWAIAHDALDLAEQLERELDEAVYHLREARYTLYVANVIGKIPMDIEDYLARIEGGQHG